MMQRKQKGFSLIEIVITMGIMSFGLLGVASTQLTAMSKSRVTFERNQATLLANELVERIRSNLPAAAAGHYNVSKDAEQGTTGYVCKGVSADCSAADMANADLTEWRQRLDAVVAGAAPEVNVDVAGGDATRATVTLNWGKNQMTLVAELM